MKKTDNYFVISNYNTDPKHLLQYCKNYTIYDQSDIPEIKNKLVGLNVIESKHTGHNISDYFRYFIDNYDYLPERMMLTKGNMIGRHISKEFFEKVYANNYYTFLYNDRKNVDKCGVAYQLYDGAFLEINNAWYAFAKTHKYFTTFNDLLVFLFKDPVIPEWVLFSPGACYIVLREQVRKYPVVFYKNLMELVSYTYFPSEAYHVERMLHIIFSANYELHDYCLDTEKFKDKIEGLSERNQKHPQKYKWVCGRIREGQHTLKLKFQSQRRRLNNLLDQILFK